MTGLRDPNAVKGICDGRVVIITGAGRGIGRAHALEFARQGAQVLVNDLGGSVHGSGTDAGPAAEVVAEIEAMGGAAVANTDDASDWEGAERMVTQAVEVFGRLDVVVNNAGILRDRTLVNMTVEEWDAVIKVHLRGTFAMSHFAAAWWRDQRKAGAPVDARIINTSSPSGLFGNAGQGNYGAAKAGIAAFTVITAKEVGKYGVTVNAVSPAAARTRMTGALGAGVEPAEGFDPLAPENISPLVVWLGSAESADVTGQVFEVFGGAVTLLEGWRRGPNAKQKARWDPAALGPVVHGLVGGERDAAVAG